jgi:hypothetical protein
MAESSNALFQSRTIEQRQNEKIYQDIDDASGEDYEGAAPAENRRASQKAGPISELGVLHARQIGDSETVCSNKLVDQRSCRRGCTAMLVQGSASISDKLLPQSRIAQQIGDSMSQLSRRIDLDCPPPT